MDEEEDEDAEEVEAGVNPPILPPIICGNLLHSFESAGDTMMKGRSTLPIQRMMMMITEVRLPLLPCHQAKLTEEVRSGRQEMGQIPEGATLFLSY